MEIDPAHSLEGLMLKLQYNVKNWLTGKDPDARKEEKGTTEDEMVRWHHQLNGHEFEQTPGDSKEQESLVCCGSWGHKESDTTEWLNWTELNIGVHVSFSVLISLDYMPRSGIAGSYGGFIPSFLNMETT